MTLLSENPLGEFLRARRLAIDPASFGFLPGRRRTPGLRREEVAQLANISPTWYTWLEQGRGGAPSREVLNRIAAGLRLTSPERDHLFILAFGHPPENRVSRSDSITPRLQRVLESLAIPAIIKTATWDVVAWNHPATVVLKDYGQLPPARRNILRLLFTDQEARGMQDDWEGVARLIVNAFRADAARLLQRKLIDWLRSYPLKVLISPACGVTTMWPGMAKGLRCCIIRKWGRLPWSSRPFLLKAGRI